MSNLNSYTPRAWFVLGESKLFSQKPRPFVFRGKELVAYRGEDKILHLLSAHCPHMGVHLGHGGKVRGNNLACRLHGWEFNGEGKCFHIPAAKEIPNNSKLKNYHVEERHGVAYFFNGAIPDYNLPFFEGENANNYIAHKGIKVHQKTTWFGPIVNAFDTQHFLYSHGYNPLKESEYNYEDKFCAKAKHVHSIKGNYWFEKVYAALLGEVANVSVSCWSGSTICVQSLLKRGGIQMIAYCTPVDSHWARTDIILYKKKSAAVFRWWDYLYLAIMAPIQRKIFQDESDELLDAQINESTLHPEIDGEIIRYLSWFKKGLGIN